MKRGRTKGALAGQLWGVASQIETFTISELAKAADMQYQEAYGVVRNWARDGLVLHDGAPRGQRYWVRGRDQYEDPTSRIWRIIRKSRTFTTKDVAVLATIPQSRVSEERVEAYVKPLVEAGLVKLRRKADEEALQPALYSLVSDPGPHAPRERRFICLFDPNSDEFLPSDRLRDQLVT